MYRVPDTTYLPNDVSLKAGYTYSTYLPVGI